MRESKDRFKLVMFATIPITVQYRTYYWLTLGQEKNYNCERHVNRPVEGRQREVGGSILQQVRSNHLALTTSLLAIL